jgi:thiamine pyrophosphokinase
MTTFVLLLGGPLTMTPRLARQTVGARFIAADSGMRHAGLFKTVPELWLGDFDSSDGALQTLWHGVERRIFPADKAKTDGELAADEAIARGATSIVMAGALGGERTDHALLHLALAVRLARAGLAVSLTSGIEEGWPLLPGASEFDLPKGTLFSILGFGNIGELTLKGAKWPLSKADVPFGSSLTLSNIASGPLSVNVISGEGILLAHLRAAE